MCVFFFLNVMANKEKKQNKRERKKKKGGKPTATKKTVQTKTRNKCQKKVAFSVFFVLNKCFRSG